MRIHRFTQSKFVENDEVRKIHHWFEDLSHGDQNISVEFFNLKLDCQMDRKVQEMVSEINTATTAGLRPLLAWYTVELDQTKLNELMKGLIVKRSWRLSARLLM